MRSAMKLNIAAAMALCLTAIGAIYQNGTVATAAVKVQQADPKITIATQAADPEYIYEPAELNAKAGQPITITNNDPKGAHSVTAKDGTFDVDVPPNGTVTLTVPKAGSFPYSCNYHPGLHNPASISVS